MYDQRARKILEVAPTIAFGGPSSHHGRGAPPPGVVSIMKEDAAAKELENLLRDALNTGIESPRGGVPIVQLKTVPLQVQHIPQKKPPTSTKPVPQRAPPPPSSARAVDQAR